jgi:hypothetical protein
MTLIGANVIALLFLATALVPPVAASAATLPLMVTPSPVSFSATTLGEKSSLQVDVFNEGDAASIEKIAIEGADPSAFFVSNNNCQVVLAEGQHCTLTIDFQPAGNGGAKQATAAIGFTGGERAEESFELTGTAVPPQLSISPLSKPKPLVLPSKLTPLTRQFRPRDRRLARLDRRDHREQRRSHSHRLLHRRHLRRRRGQLPLAG